MSIASIAPSTLAAHLAEALQVLDDPPKWQTFSRAWTQNPMLMGVVCVSQTLPVLFDLVAHLGVDYFLECIGFENAHIALFHFQDAIIHKLGERAAYGF
jgi:hypothetical protein